MELSPALRAKLRVFRTRYIGERIKKKKNELYKCTSTRRSQISRIQSLVSMHLSLHEYVSAFLFGSCIGRKCRKLHFLSFSRDEHTCDDNFMKPYRFNDGSTRCDRDPPAREGDVCPYWMTIREIGDTWASEHSMQFAEFD